ncbi:hypothetical protein RND81_09G136200 [Saponaria officinalis]|uniref:SCP domain-containing protein n=1 Tax=Saponaria officinalis TaxID=3572 RepID=A0AAW1ILP6_SAPOF
MALSTFSLAIVLVFGLSVAHIYALTSLLDLKLQYVVPQNLARAKVLMPPVVWNDTLAQYAQAYAHERAADCALQHSNYLIPGYGETIAVGSGDLSPAEAIDLWVGEKPYYDYKTNSCAEGQMCGHYTQVIWRNTKSIGCASAKCQNGGTFITCNYYPPGNYIGERPY